MKHNNLFSLLSNLRFKRQRQDFEGVTIVTTRRGLKGQYGKNRAIKVKYEGGTGIFRQYNNHIRVVVPRLRYDDAVSSTEWKLRILKKKNRKLSNTKPTMILQANGDIQIFIINKFYNASMFPLFRVLK